MEIEGETIAAASTTTAPDGDIMVQAFLAGDMTEDKLAMSLGTIIDAVEKEYPNFRSKFKTILEKQLDPEKPIFSMEFSILHDRSRAIFHGEVTMKKIIRLFFFAMEKIEEAYPGFSLSLYMKRKKGGKENLN